MLPGASDTEGSPSARSTAHTFILLAFDGQIFGHSKDHRLSRKQQEQYRNCGTHARFVVRKTREGDHLSKQDEDTEKAGRQRTENMERSKVDTNLRNHM